MEIEKEYIKKTINELVKAADSIIIYYLDHSVIGKHGYQ